MARLDPEIAAHLEWIGYVQPTGLVVSAPALVRAGAILNRRDAAGQQRLRACVEERTFHPNEGPVPWVPDFPAFARQVLGWSFSPRGYAGTPEHPIPPELELTLPEYGETLRPDLAVREPEPQDGGPAWQLLVRVLEPGEDPDRPVRGKGGLEASAHGRMERLLRDKRVAAGLLFNGRTLRLVSAPRGESSGWMDFRVTDMVQTAGRPISTALRLLLDQTRLLSLPRARRLAALLEESRRYQNEVSERLAEQVLHALYEFLRGFQAAHDASRGELLREPLAEHPDRVYHALLTVILRLVFLLYAEERDMLPEDETFLRYYSLGGLYERLREDAALYPDTMEQRYGAWAQLLVLFRLIHDGAEAGAMRLPRRHGVLFDPDRFTFLEGRTEAGARQVHERIEPPLVPDGTVYRALEKLLVLDGERISYRALDVEQIGSVYETMMGFRLETAAGPSAAVKAARRHGAPATIDLEELRREPPARRDRWIQTRTDRKLTDRVLRAVREADTLEDLHAALEPVLDKDATPDLVPEGAMILQPSEERRRSGSHYTPRALTGPIVRTTLEPILERLSGSGAVPAASPAKSRGQPARSPRPEQILDLKVCDPAMGSGAFLVEACRQLGDALVESWHAHDALPPIPRDEDEVVLARRLVAQRCLYGLDRNPVAVDLAKMSLWLVTLARDHPLTFVDHALRHGDSLVGLSRKQIEAFHWQADAPDFDAGFETMQVGEHMARVAGLRDRIRKAGDEVSDWELRDLWDEARFELDKVRLFGDLVIAAFFEAARPRDREAKRNEYAGLVLGGEAQGRREWLDAWRHAARPLAPFHWEIEFPEVFERENPGFDAFVGNPPFAGKNTVGSANAAGYPDWLQQIHPESHGNADLVAHFFRRAFDLLRPAGAFGLIATNTIAQGDTRATGLRWICRNGGEIYCARKRVKWPGLAAVVVSVLHVTKGPFPGARTLDDRNAERITAFLFHRGGHEDPARLRANEGRSFVGSYVLGMGFTFDDTDRKGVATPLAEMERLIDRDPRNREVIFPYIGGEEVNTSPTHVHHRYVINFGEMPLRREDSDHRDVINLGETQVRQEDSGKSWARATERERAAFLRSGILPADYPGPVAADWPDLLRIVEEKVKPKRMTDNREAYRRYWWQYAEKRGDLATAIAGLERVLVISRVGNAFAFCFKEGRCVFSERLVVFPISTSAGFATVQSRVHEIWARFLSATLKDDLMYAPSDCFETFPFPENWETHQVLEAAGRKCHEFRASLMVQNGQGLTKTYNRFHDPDERAPEILELRELHAAMDRAVLRAYGWDDIPTECAFLLDYEVEDDEDGRRRKPWRYRWPDEVRDEVLARLLELNAARAREEERAVLAQGKSSAARARNKRAPKAPQPDELFS